VLVHAPPGLPRDGALPIVLFLHGWGGCARVLVHSGPRPCREGEPARTGWGLGAAHDAAGLSSVLILPQLAWRRRSGAPGALGRRGFARALVEGSLEAALETSGHPNPHSRAGSVTLIAHSAGFESALAVLAQGDIDVRTLILMDALYAGTDRFAAWLLASPERRLLSFFRGRGSTARESERLRSLLEARLGPEAVLRTLPPDEGAEAPSWRAFIGRSSAPHAEIPARHLSEALVAAAIAEPRLPSERGAPRPGALSPRPRPTR